MKKLVPEIETGVVLVADASLAVASIPAIHALNPKVGAICLAVQNIALLAQKAVLKIQANPALEDILTAPLESAEKPDLTDTPAAS